MKNKTRFHKWKYIKENDFLKRKRRYCTRCCCSEELGYSVLSELKYFFTSYTHIDELMSWDLHDSIWQKLIDYMTHFTRCKNEVILYQKGK